MVVVFVMKKKEMVNIDIEFFHSCPKGEDWTIAYLILFNKFFLNSSVN